MKLVKERKTRITLCHNTFWLKVGLFQFHLPLIHIHSRKSPPVKLKHLRERKRNWKEMVGERKDKAEKVERREKYAEGSPTRIVDHNDDNN